MSAAEADRCLHDLFGEQARRTPQALAIVDERGELTYGELDHRADLLAARLRSAGVGPDEVVGVYMERCAEYIVACLAVLKAGGAYLPLELAYPGPLLAEVVSDSDLRVVLTKDRYAGRLPEEREKLCLDEGWESALGAPESGGAPEVDQENLAFVSYSSGTTGKPKGIANPHRAAVRSYLWRFGISDYAPGDRVGCNVFFIWEMLRPLLRGATTVVIPDDVIYDPAALVRFLEDYEVSEVLMTPSLLEAVLNAGGPDLDKRLSGLRTLWLNGEVVTRTLARRAMSLLPGARLFNVYSCSETHEVAAGDLSELAENPHSTYCPVGRPMDPETLYILDAENRPVPDGEAGELYVGGGCLARGYVNLPEKTGESFPPDPFSGEDGARMYRTGDKARILPDGSLEILGRTDFMVKVRGYSVELGAVEAAIEKELAVTACVVVAEGEEGEDKRLLAYLVPSSGNEERYSGWEIDPRTGRSKEIRGRLRDALPHYAVPAVFVELDSLPIQETSGKVDRKRLPEPPPRLAPAAADPTKPARRLSADAPRPEKVSALIRVWEQILRLERGDVRPDDDFFDLGGHSLAAAQLSGRVEEVFGVHVSMPLFMEDPTVEGLCDRIEALQRGEAHVPESPAPDLRAGAVLEPEITPERPPYATALRDARTVFLTGATGFLGAFLLDALLSETDASVRCLVRSRGDADLLSPIRDNLRRYGLWRPERAERVVPVSGDLGEPLLGFPESAFDALAREVDVIFHAGAMVNLVYPYPALKPANVGGTREVLRLACRHAAKPLHHVSTNGIFPADGRLCEEDVDLDALAGAREDGYGQSKWVAEKLVRQAGERGLPVRVYRPGNVSGHSESGAANPRDFLGAVVVESLRLGKAPEIEGWRMEMTPVDLVAGAILRLADDPRTVGGTFHLANPDPPFAAEVFDRLEALGYPLERVPYAAWISASRSAARDGNHRGPGDVIGGVLRGAPASAGELRDGNTYDDANTRRALADGGPYRPAFDAALIERYARYFVEQGWLEAPPALSAGRGRTPGLIVNGEPSGGTLRGRVAVVTGASSGIGAAVSRALAREGASVAVAARREDALREVWTQMDGSGAKSIAVPTDVTERDQVEELVDRAGEELGPVEILVNCAGVMYYTLMKNLREDEWERTVEVNCKGALNCVGAVLPGMLERGRGHIVTISSDAGRKVFPGLAVYSASKFFVEALSKGLRLEVAGTGVKVTTVQPGNVETDLLKLSGDAEALKVYGEPTGARVLDPDDVAASVVHALRQPEHVAVNEVLVQPRDEPA